MDNPDMAISLFFRKVPLQVLHRKHTAIFRCKLLNESIVACCLIQRKLENISQPVGPRKQNGLMPLVGVKCVTHSAI